MVGARLGLSTSWSHCLALQLGDLSLWELANKFNNQPSVQCISDHVSGFIGSLAEPLSQSPWVGTALGLRQTPQVSATRTSVPRVPVHVPACRWIPQHMNELTIMLDDSDGHPGGSCALNNWIFLALQPPSQPRELQQQHHNSPPSSIPDPNKLPSCPKKVSQVVQHSELPHRPTSCPPGPPESFDTTFGPQGTTAARTQPPVTCACPK